MVLPDVKSFSPTNLKYMRYFYELYPCAGNRPQAVDDSTIVFRIPWGHNRTIIDKCKNNVDKGIVLCEKNTRKIIGLVMILVKFFRYGFI